MSHTMATLISASLAVSLQAFCTSTRALGQDQGLLLSSSSIAQWLWSTMLYFQGVLLDKFSCSGEKPLREAEMRAGGQSCQNLLYLKKKREKRKKKKEFYIYLCCCLENVPNGLISGQKMPHLQFNLVQNLCQEDKSCSRQGQHLFYTFPQYASCFIGHTSYQAFFFAVPKE